MDWKGTITMNGNDNYPINLLDESAGGRWEDDLPKDITGSLEYVLEGLPERDGRVIRARFRDKKSLEEIAKSENVSRERIRQITGKAIKKLAHPLRRNYLIYGVKGMENRAVQQAVSKQLYAATKSILDISEILGNALPDSLGSLKFTEIDELDLSVRGYSCLKRAGLNTLGDICALSLDELANVRNLGEKTFDEIVKVVHKYNLKFKDE